MSVKRYGEWGCCDHGNEEQLYNGQETCVSSVDYNALAARLAKAEAALRLAAGHISNTPHGDNCYLTDEYPGNVCRCGKESMLSFLDADLADEPQKGQP